MSNADFLSLRQISVVDVTGVDAAAILHNLTTNEIKSLEDGSGRETFVTDVRGKTLGHVHLFRQPDGFRLIGAADQSERIAAHIDRYTIREDATAVAGDDRWSAIVIAPKSVGAIGGRPGTDAATGELVCCDRDARGACLPDALAWRRDSGRASRSGGAR